MAGFAARPSWWTAAASGLIATALSSDPAEAENLRSALARAYGGNPDLNQSRASVRAQDEDVPKALSLSRPKASFLAAAGQNYEYVRVPAGRDPTGTRAFTSDRYQSQPRGVALSLSQNVFDGGLTVSSVRQAESGVFAARANLRLTEQSILQNGAAAYMNVSRDSATVLLMANNVAVLERQLGDTRTRFAVGDVTATDVAQAEAALAEARTAVSNAKAQLRNSVASYRQIIGNDPDKLQPAASLEPLLPKSLKSAVDVALAEHPGVVAANHQVDAMEHAVKVAESALSPTASVHASAWSERDFFLGTPGSRTAGAQIEGRLDVPLYQGGEEYAGIRQAKERFSQARFNADLQRDSVRASVVSSYGQLETAKASVVSGRAAVKASEIALYSIREEAKVGMRTTLDILNAQQALLRARVGLINAQRDVVVASYAALASIGRLSARTLGLEAAIYDPIDHFDAVKDKWFGVEAGPQGR